MKLRVSDYIAGFLAEAGIRRVFCVTGGGAMFLNDSLGHHPRLTVLYNHHEQASAMAAEAYARIHNRIAALCVTTGPGGTNAITGVLGGWLDSIPMLVLSGQVRSDLTARFSGVGIRALGDQEFDICRAVESMTKYARMVTDASKIRYYMEKALYLAYSGRPGPVWLDIPLDIQGAFVDPGSLEGFDREGYEKEERKKGILPESVTEETARAIIERIRQAQRPVFNAGNGIRIGGAHREFMLLAKKLGIPVCVGWNSEDCLFVDHPLYVGRPGNFGDRPGNFAVQNADLVFSVGSRLSLRQVGFNYRGWAREAFTIVNDIDREELKKPTLHVSMAVHAHCRDLMEAMLRLLQTEETPVWKGGEGLAGKTWQETCRWWKERYPVCREEFLKRDDKKSANVYAFIDAIGRAAGEDRIVVVGNGSACVVGGHSYIVKKGQRFISNSGAASMGYDLPAAIGAYTALLDEGGYQKPLILITGDGSLQMNLQELQTILHHRMEIKIFLINNGGYHSIRQTQTKFFGDRPLVGIGEDSFDLSFPSMERLAVAYGYPYFCAKTNSELAEAVKKTLEEPGPVICEAFVGKDQNFEPKSSGKQLPDGRMVSPPLEDLMPFLPEEEMEANMIVPRMKE